MYAIVLLLLVAILSHLITKILRRYTDLDVRDLRPVAAPGR